MAELCRFPLLHLLVLPLSHHAISSIGVRKLLIRWLKRTVYWLFACHFLDIKEGWMVLLLIIGYRAEVLRAAFLAKQSFINLQWRPLFGCTLNPILFAGIVETMIGKPLIWDPVSLIIEWQRFDVTWERWVIVFLHSKGDCLDFWPIQWRILHREGLVALPL